MVNVGAVMLATVSCMLPLPIAALTLFWISAPIVSTSTASKVLNILAGLAVLVAGTWISYTASTTPPVSRRKLKREPNNRLEAFATDSVTLTRCTGRPLTVARLCAIARLAAGLATNAAGSGTLMSMEPPMVPANSRGVVVLDVVAVPVVVLVAVVVAVVEDVPVNVVSVVLIVVVLDSVPVVLLVLVVVIVVVTVVLDVSDAVVRVEVVREVVVLVMVMVEVSLSVLVKVVVAGVVLVLDVPVMLVSLVCEVVVV